MARMTDTKITTGACLCGQVKFTITGPLRPIIYCHCEQCRRTSGHFVAATAASTDQLSFACDTGLKWYRSSNIAQRGFCSACGSSLFWQPDHGDYLSVMAGGLDQTGDLHAAEHIYVDNAAEYYDIADGLPQFAENNPHIADWVSK